MSPELPLYAWSQQILLRITSFTKGLNNFTPHQTKVNNTETLNQSTLFQNTFKVLFSEYLISVICSTIE